MRAGQLIEMSEQLNRLQYSDEYAEFVMNNASPDEYVICNGDTLLDAMEAGYLFDEFLESRLP